MRLSSRIGLYLGPLAALLVLLGPCPPELGVQGQRAGAVAVLMASWWITEAIPLSATALVPLVALPVLGVADMETAAAPYAHRLVFLALGGFALARAMERWGLHRRLALAIVARAGTRPERLVLGFMLASAFLSMWISNTAACAMLLPVALALGALLRGGSGERSNFVVCLLLGIAYAASIGGVATLIGTPPNAVLASQASELLDVEIGFLDWMKVGLPLSALLLPCAWLLLTRVLLPPEPLRADAQAVLALERARAGRPSRGERTVGVVLLLAVAAWLLRAPKTIGPIELPGLQTWAPLIDDSTISMAAALLLFVLPVDAKRGVFALDWKTAEGLPWGILILFGGGLSLARAMTESGLSAWIGGGLAGVGGLPAWGLLLAVALLFVFLTEVSSNVATASLAMPILVGLGASLGIDPLPLMTTAALASSMAFMLPVATPPNAIVFGSGKIPLPQMVRAGLCLNLIAAVAAATVGATLVPWLLA